MKNNFIYRHGLIATMLFFPPAVALAGNGYHQPLYISQRFINEKMPGDTLPDSKQAPESIKEVPKSHKQTKPVALPVTSINPVLVKPKIIVKPVIRIH